MQARHLNIFVPYENKPLHHEDQLTRALLILLRSIKLVEQLFIELLRDRMRASGIDTLPPSLHSEVGGVESLETQVWSSTKERLQGESGRLVSVVVTDKLLAPDHRVERTERLAVYDGFMRLKPNWVVVLENKPAHGNIWVEQLSSAFNEDYEIEPIPVVITWSEIIRRLGLLITNGLLQDAGKSLVEDFIAYVGEYFPELNPYESFTLCGNQYHLLEKHCQQIMAEVALGPVEYHRGWHYSIRLSSNPIVKEVSLHPNCDSDGPWPIQLEVHPGDTMNQARALFSSIDISFLAQLMESGWSVEPNFHIAFMSSNLEWCESKVSLNDYVKHWTREVAANHLRQVSRTDWPAYFAALEAKGIIMPQEARRINDYLGSTAMSTINICPGISFRYCWTREDAIRLEQAGSFTKDFEEKVHQILAAW